MACTIAITSCTGKHNPTLPLIKYDQETNNLIIIQTDTAAHDTATIQIEGFYNQSIPVKDTVSLSIGKIVNNFDQIKFAYELATHDNSQSILVHTSRTNDTIYKYTHKTIEIAPIPVAKVISGNCIGLQDVNYQRDYREKIRLWIFQNKINPDSILIEKMNSLMKQFNYSGHNEYSKLAGDPPILKSIKDTRYRFDIDIPGKYFYLYAAQYVNNLKHFIEKKISEGLKDAHSSPKDEFICKQPGDVGPNCLFMIGINEDWNYTVVPLGIVFVDNEAPHIYASDFTMPHNSMYSRVFSQLPKLGESEPWRNSFFLKNQDILVNFPQPPSSITSKVSINYGNFQGNEYFGFNIPFYISVSGDVQIITIGGHKLDAKNIKNGECIRLQIKGLHVGDNSLSLSATDTRGNKSTSSLPISIVSTHNNTNYDDDDDYDYDDLDSRISDLEDRLNDLDY